MKKKIISAAILLAAAVVATSCAKEFQSNDSIPGGNGTFTGVIEQFGDATKTVLTSPDPTSRKVEWEDTDVVRINDGFFSVAPNESDATKADFTFVSGTEPATGPYTAYYPSTLYDGSKTAIASSYDAVSWATAEVNGFVCLPAAGFRDEGQVQNIGEGYYWSSSPTSDSEYAFHMHITSGSIGCGYDHRFLGQSVRLVTE